MNCDEIFKKAYLQQLNIINEDGLINISGNSIGSGNSSSSSFTNSPVSNLTDVANGNDVDADVEVDGAKNEVDADVDGDISEEKLTEEDIDELDDSEELPLQKVCFVTTDQALIDALNSGFEEVVIFTNAKDEETGEDTVVEVKFGKDSFGELEISAAEEDEEDTESDEIDEFEECKSYDFKY